MDTLVGLAGTVMMLVEVLSRILAQVKIPDEIRKLALLVISVVLGVVVVATSPGAVDDAGVQAILGVLPSWLQILVAGVLVGMGSKAIHEVFGIANRLKESLAMLAETRKEEARAMRAGTINFVSQGVTQQASAPYPHDH